MRIVLVAVAVLALAGCSSASTVTVTITATPSSTPTVTSSSPTPNPTSASSTPTVTAVTVDIACYDYDDLPYNTWTLDVAAPNFKSVWRGARAAEYCEAERSTDRQWSPLEARVIKATGTSVDPASVWAVCSGAPAGYMASDFAAPGFVPEDEDLALIRGALVMCPTAPGSKAWRVALQRGREVAGGTFINGDGNYAVPGEVKPGVYVTTDSVSDCYWERVDDSGGTIDNGFVTGAPRVKVTIESSDAGFNTEGCGSWRRE